MRKVHMCGAALALATAMFWGTMLTSPPTTEAALSSSPSAAACTEAGRSSALWVHAQTHGRAWMRAESQDNFNLILAWVGKAQDQCASGATQRSIENFRAIEGMIAALEVRRRATDDE
ncbi:MAG TPA: hypothetical protein VHG30_07955 [Microvirga sp.]|jgi:hypothetical protein|nr:hypothetical protein [Microvirga sp.]